MFQYSDSVLLQSLSPIIFHMEFHNPKEPRNWKKVTFWFNCLKSGHFNERFWKILFDLSKLFFTEIQTRGNVF